MKDERETKEKLLASAEHEFMEKGYQGASLRNICKNAGVTTGALYFFFKDKDDIFASLVAPVLGSIRTMMEAHMQQELQEVKGELQEGKDDFSDDIYASRRIIHELYQNYDRVQILTHPYSWTKKGHDNLENFRTLLQERNAELY